ncbi:HolB ATPase involved in DNA replication [Rhabdaerophilaceae bacterium]
MPAVEFLPAGASEHPDPDRIEACPLPREMLSFFGHEEIEAAFLDGYRAGRLHHAFLLTGPEGVGKATFAFRAARFLLSEDQAGQSADALFAPAPPDTLQIPRQARAALLIANEAHPDLAVLRRRYDAKTKRMRMEISVEDTRNALSLLTKTAAFGGWRVVIVDTADDLNTASANAILKKLEEPPEKAVFFLISNQPGRLLPTIRSRCQVLAFKPLPTATLVEIISGVGRPASDPAALEKLSEGSVRRALRLGEGSAGQLALALDHVFAGLPSLDARALAMVSDSLRAGQEGVQALADLLDRLERFLAEGTRRLVSEGAPLSQVVGFAEFWSRQQEQAQKVEALNLDRKAFAAVLFDELATLVSGAKR